jgi:hypothetical protein
MSLEAALTARREAQAAVQAVYRRRAQFNELFRNAWYSIAEERGWRRDVFLGTASHGTIALRSYLAVRGL